jgi:hypothetical protein
MFTPTLTAMLDYLAALSGCHSVCMEAVPDLRVRLISHNPSYWQPRQITTSRLHVSYKSSCELYSFVFSYGLTLQSFNYICPMNTHCVQRAATETDWPPLKQTDCHWNSRATTETVQPPLNQTGQHWNSRAATEPDTAMESWRSAQQHYVTWELSRSLLKMQTVWGRRFAYGSWSVPSFLYMLRERLICCVILGVRLQLFLFCLT